MIPFLLIAGGGYLLFDALGNSRKSFDPLDYGFPTKGYRGYRKGAAHFSDGGMTAGRWYRDKSGEEFKYIGKMDNGPDKGKLMFSDGKKHVYKTLEDFEGARPKESKLFGWFADGGAIQKGDLVRLKEDKNVVQVVDDVNKDWSEWEKVVNYTIVGKDKKGRNIYNFR